MSGNFQTLPGSSSLDLSGVNAGQLLQKDSFGAIVGTDPTTGPDFSEVGTNQLIKKLDSGFAGYDPTALGAKKTIKVASANADETSIQAAIDAASVGDVVEVQPGTYTEAITLKKGVILYLHSGVIVQYTENNSTPTLYFAGDSYNNDEPFVYVDAQDGHLYKQYVLGEGTFRRFTADAYGNAQETSTPTILIENPDFNPNFHVVLQAREIGLFSQTAHRTSIKADTINKIYATGVFGHGDYFVRQVVEAESITVAYCENGAIQEINVQRLLMSAYAFGGLTATNDANLPQGLKTNQTINAFSVAPVDVPGQGLGGDGCWVDGGATQKVTATYLAAAVNQGGKQTVNAATVGTFRTASSILPALTTGQCSYCRHVSIGPRTDFFLQAAFIFDIDCDSSGKAVIKANQIGYSSELFETLGFFNSSDVGSSGGISQLVSLNNNLSDDSLPASHLEIIGARIVQSYYVSNAPYYPILHTAGHLILRDCVIVTHPDCPYSIYSQNSGITGNHLEASLRLFNAYSNKEGYRPLDGSSNPIPPDYGTLTVDTAVVL